MIANFLLKSLIPCSILWSSQALAVDYYIECPKPKSSEAGNSKLDNKSLESVSIYLGKDSELASKVGSLLEKCGNLHVGHGSHEIVRKSDENPFSELYRRYKKSGVTEKDLIDFLIPLNQGDAKSMLENAASNLSSRQAPGGGSTRK